jgi:hypothetical protein
MAVPTVASAKRFVTKAIIPSRRPARAAERPLVETVFDEAKHQSVIVGSEVLSFVQGVTTERREAIINSSLLAQLVAKQKVSDPTKADQWYDAYFDVLSSIGWVVQDKTFSVYHEQSHGFEAQKAIIAIATTVLGQAPTALAIVKSVLDGLQSIDQNNPWITLFNRESETAHTARFQIGLADEDADGQFFVTLMAFVLDAKSKITQVLFFKAKSSEATLRHYSSKMTINTTVLDAVRKPLNDKLSALAVDFVKMLPDDLSVPPSDKGRPYRTRRASSSAARSAAKARAMSVHVGLNSVNPGKYDGWSGDLVACESDAHDMASIARSAGMAPKLLLTKRGTRANTLLAIRDAAKRLGDGDLFFLTYSGHGGQVPDLNGDEVDRNDETWCLYDGELIDDELYVELSRFAPGVRVLILSDSCHSGTMSRERPLVGTGARSKQMPPSIAARVYQSHRAFYDDLQRKATSASNGRVIEPESAAGSRAAGARRVSIAAASLVPIVLVSGCKDNQTSADGDHNGRFTEQVLKVWSHGRFSGDYPRFHAEIVAGMPSDQTPNLYTLGPVGAFLRQRPFTI